MLEELADIALTENICQEKSKGNGKGKKTDSSPKADVNTVKNKKKTSNAKPDSLIARLDAQAKAQAAQGAQIEKLTACVSNLTGIIAGGHNSGLAQVANVNYANLLHSVGNSGPCPPNNSHTSFNFGDSVNGNVNGVMYRPQGQHASGNQPQVGNQNQGNHTQGVNQNNQNQGGNPGQNSGKNVKWPKGFCGNCVGTNVRFCIHCLYCGSTDHQLRDCPLLKNNEKNEPAL